MPDKSNNALSMFACLIGLKLRMSRRSLQLPKASACQKAAHTARADAALPVSYYIIT